MHAILLMLNTVSTVAGEVQKWIAISLNVLLVMAVIYLFATKGAPNKDEAFVVVLLCVAPISSLIALSLKGGEGWLGLYFKRKALEEKQKIEKLGGHKN